MCSWYRPPVRMSTVPSTVGMNTIAEAGRGNDSLPDENPLPVLPIRFSARAFFYIPFLMLPVFSQFTGQLLQPLQISKINLFCYFDFFVEQLLFILRIFFIIIPYKKFFKHQFLFRIDLSIF